MKLAGTLFFALALLLWAPMALHGVEATDGANPMKDASAAASEVSLQEAAPPESQTLAIDGANCPLQMAGPPLPHCGDICFDPGLSRGCIDSSGSTWKRVQCTCQNGSWLCGIF